VLASPGGSSLSALLPYAQSFTVVVFLGATTGGATLYYLVRRPSAVASACRREIETTLPHAIFSMYSLSRDGMDTEKVFRRLVASENQYGEVAKEFQALVNDMDYFGTDIITPIRNTRNRTPSTGLSTFLETSSP